MPEELPKVKLSRQPIDFEQDCMDPVAQVIITEALQYAIEKAQSRLTSVGRIFTNVEASGQKTLAVINEIKNQIAGYPKCKIDKNESLAASITPVPFKMPAKPTRKAIIKTLEDAARRAQPEPEIKGKVTVIAPEKKVIAPRTQPARWQKVEVINEKGETQVFDSPGDAATALGVLTEHARNQVHAFRRAGFEVTGNGEPVKGVGRFIIKSTGKPIPEQYKLTLKPVIEEKPAPGTGAKIEAAEPMRLIPVMMRKEGSTKIEVIGYDVISSEKKKEGLAIKRLTREEGEALLATRKAILEH